MKNSPVKSAARVIEILELFTERQAPLTLTQITEHLFYPLSSTTMLLKSLVKLGYLNFNTATRTYLPTTKVKSLGDWILPEGLSDHGLVSLLAELRQETCETVVLGVQNDIYIHFIRVLDSDQAVRFYVPEGGMRTLLQSNLGWILLAQSPDERIDRMVERIRCEEPKKSKNFDPQAFRAEILKIRSSDYCYVHNLPTEGAGSIAMLLPCEYNGQPLVIAVGGLIQRLDANRDRIVGTMRRLIRNFMTNQSPPVNPSGIALAEN